ncbi:MAG TPA: hypothetical protein VFE15_10175 [Marmoricola sp.]|nr:hypothetical protein [Marmoricola sp.]
MGERDVPTEQSDQAADAMSAVQLGIWVSATRCVLTYVVAPAVGALGLILGPFGLLLQILGAITSTYGARRLWATGHRARYLYAFVATAATAASVLAVAQAAGEAVR